MFGAVVGYHKNLFAGQRVVSGQSLRYLYGHGLFLAYILIKTKCGIA
jgi:hypothetical protein